MNSNHIAQEDLPLIALQFLPEQDMADATLHLDHCDLCRKELAQYQGDFAAYAMTSEMHSPPAQARERLMRRVAKEKKVIPIEAPADRAAEVAARPSERLQPVTTAFTFPAISAVPAAASSSSASNDHLFTETDQPFQSRSRGMFETYEEPRQRSGKVTSIAAWTGWAIAAGLGVVAFMQFHQRQLTQTSLADTTAQLTASNSAGSKAQQVLQTLTDEGALQVTMRIPQPEGVPAPTLPEGHAAYDANKGALVFVASNLLSVPAEKTYELWVLPKEKGGAPVPAGTFRPDQNGNATVVMPEIPRGVAAQGFGVTIEDVGGAKSPTLPIVLVGL